VKYRLIYTRRALRDIDGLDDLTKKRIAKTLARYEGDLRLLAFGYEHDEPVMAALFVADDFIALFSFAKSDRGVALYNEKHYRLAPPDQMAIEDH
jgi:hypothetical protein